MAGVLVDGLLGRFHGVNVGC